MSATAERTLTLRELNRALLARQLLLERPALAAEEAIARVAGLQGQSPAPPFTGLWARLDGFDADELRALIDARRVVRAPFVRHTVHLVTADDYLLLRGPVQPALERHFQGTRKRMTEAELERALALGRELFAAGPATFADLKRALGEHLPDGYHQGLLYAVRTYLPLIGVPEDTRWSFSTKARFVLAEKWLGRPVPDERDPRELIRRYLAAFGPATVADIQSWSSVPRLRASVEALRPELNTFRDERGRELFDVPGAPLPDGDTPVPLRFTAEFDNALLGFADRSRIIADEHKRRVFNEAKNGRIPGAFLFDGFVAGRWWLERAKQNATLVLEPFRSLTRAERKELEAGALPLLEFIGPDASTRDLRFEPPA